VLLWYCSDTALVLLWYCLWYCSGARLDAERAVEATSRAGVHAAAPRAPRATSRHPRRSSHVSSHGPALRVTGYGLAPGAARPRAAHRVTHTVAPHVCRVTLYSRVSCNMWAFHDSSPPSCDHHLSSHDRHRPSAWGRLRWKQCREARALRAPSPAVWRSTRLWRVWYVVHFPAWARLRPGGDPGRVGVPSRVCRNAKAKRKRGQKCARAAAARVFNFQFHVHHHAP
jgi:hypothetical protein